MNKLSLYSVGVFLLLTGAACGPRSGEDQFSEGVNALHGSRYRRAERLLLAATAAMPNHANAFANLALAQWKRGALPEAIVSMRQAVMLAPDDAEFREYLGLLLLEAREYREAAPLLQEAAAASPGNPRLTTGLAVARWRLGETDNAYSLLSAVFERNPDYAPAVYNLALYHLEELQEAGRARDLLQRYVTLAPDGERIADARRRLRSLEREIRRRTPGDDPRFERPADGPRSPFESSSPRLINSAKAALHRGDYDEANIHLRAAVRHDEQDAHALWLMGEFAEEHLQSPERAARIWRDFINRFPEDPRAPQVRQRLTRLADALEGRQEPHEAAGGMDETSIVQLEFNRPARRDPEGARREFLRGVEYQADGDLDRAEFHLRRAIEQDDTHLNAFIQLANVYQNSGELQLALDACNYALGLRPDLYFVRLQSARLLLRMGARSRAMVELRNILRAQPDHPEAHLLMGIILRADQDTQEQARDHFRSYLESAPDEGHAERIRNWLDAGGV